MVDSLRGGLSHRVSLEVSSGVCRGQGSQIQDRAVTGCRRRCSSGVCRGQGSQIQDRAVTQGVGGGVVGVCKGLVCVVGVSGVRVRRSKTGLSHRVSLEV